MTLSDFFGFPFILYIEIVYEWNEFIYINSFKCRKNRLV